ncbi:ATP-binding protein [Ramlibacter aurantiacus]|nr:ATP-binding protein [Ramlibacter aurantiacus]
MPIALISLVDSDRQWFKSAVGLQQGDETARDVSFCGHAILQPQLFEVEDARADLRFHDNPLVLEAPNVAHYAGMPLVMPSGEAVGTLCVLSPRPGRLTGEQRRLLSELARGVVDVLLLRQDELQLKEERRTAEAVRMSELAPAGMFSADERGQVLHGNNQWVTILGGHSLAALEGSAWMQCIHPEDRPGLQAAWEQTVQERSGYEGTFRCQPLGDEAPRWVRIRCEPVESSGSRVAFVGVVTDTTETLRLQEELNRQNRLLARALEASNLGLWEYDLGARCVYLSAGWTQLLGLPGQDWQVRPKATRSFFPQQARPTILAAWRQLLNGEVDRVSLEHEMIMESGEPIWVVSEAQVLERDTSGRARHVVGTSKDITARVRADAELRAALQAADQASVAKSDFLATMSHEIRTPLNGVIGLTQLLREASLPPMESDSVTLIDSCAKSLLSLVDNILDFSKIEAGHLTLEEVPTDLPQMLQELGDLFTARAAEKGIRFDLHQQPGLPRWIATDPGRLRQVLLNLLGNALKFTDMGNFGLRVTTRESDAGLRLSFAVTDTGPGIPAEAQARLFTRFTQAGNPSLRKSGTGLGLAISRQLAQLMGGDVTLVSQEGLGSRFTLEIPLRTAAPPLAVQIMAEARVIRSDARLLLAEDNEVNQLVAQRILASLGFTQLTVVENGQDAVRACQEAPFDLVLMDCHMPVLDGWNAARELRRLGVTIPILAFTAAATLGDRDRCLAAGMNDYLTKPVEKAVFAEKLRRWLTGAAEPHASPSLLRAAPGSSDVFDHGVIGRYFGDDAQAFAAALEMFLRQSRESLAQLKAAGGEGMARLMHGMRGSAATLGGTRLSALCAGLEVSPDYEQMDTVATEVERFASAARAFNGFAGPERLRT